jgi:lysophospholipase L1-like esterase
LALVVSAGVVGLSVLRAAPPAGGVAAPPASAPAKPVFYLIGDSTVSNGANLGWDSGPAIGSLFDPAKVTVQNAARGGRSARSFYSEGLWDAVKNKLKPGDFVAMQFGTNDGGDPKTSTNGRPDLPGTGEETTTGRASTGGKEETVHTFGWYMKQYVLDTKAKGATPIMLTMVPHNAWADGKVRRDTNTYVKWAKEVAEANGAYYIDLNGVAAKRYEKEGQENMAKFFNADRTHSLPAGAMANAEAVVSGVRALPGLKLNEYLSEAGKKVPAADAEDVMAPKAGAATAAAEKAGG